MSSRSTYLFYVDASGDAGKYVGTNTRYYALIALGILVENRLSIDKDFNDILSTFFKGLIPKEINSRDIVNCRRSFAHLGKDDKRRLVISLLELLVKHNVVCVAVVVDKVRYWECYEASSDLIKKWSMHILIDRIDLMLERNNSLGIITYDYEGKKDELYRELLDELRKSGSIMWPSMQRRKIKNIIDTIYFLPSHLSCGLQLADLVAYHLRGRYESPSKVEATFPLIEKILDKDPKTGKYLNWGLKLLPPSQ